MGEVVNVLVCFDHGNARYEGEEGEKVERGVDALADAFGVGGGGGLEDQDRLD